jgi:hypothetical protein
MPISARFDVAGLLIDFGDDNFGAFGGHGFRRSASDADARAGDECDLAGQSGHRCSSSFCSVPSLGRISWWIKWQDKYGGGVCQEAYGRKSGIAGRVAVPGAWLHARSPALGAGTTGRTLLAAVSPLWARDLP